MYIVRVTSDNSFIQIFRKVLQKRKLFFDIRKKRKKERRKKEKEKRILRGRKIDFGEKLSLAFVKILIMALFNRRYKNWL